MAFMKQLTCKDSEMTFMYAQDACLCSRHYSSYVLTLCLFKIDFKSGAIRLSLKLSNFSLFPGHFPCFSIVSLFDHILAQAIL